MKNVACINAVCKNTESTICSSKYPLSLGYDNSINYNELTEQDLSGGKCYLKP